MVSERNGNRGGGRAAKSQGVCTSSLSDNKHSRNANIFGLDDGDEPRNIIKHEMIDR